MAVDKNKIVAEATKLVQKGAYDKAIQAYQRILAEDPKDVRVLLKVGELQQKKGDNKGASLAFARVAETYAEQGFFLKSVAVYKQIVKLDPDDVRVNERLAALYQQLGLMSDAMGQYQFMATAYERAGDGAKLTDVLKRMVELDPENIASSIKLGELYARSQHVGSALECFNRAAQYLKKHNRADEYLKVAERIAALSPDDLALTRELANIYLAKSDTKRALAKLQLCFKADPKDVDTLNLLAQAFRDLGQSSKTLSVYKELARVHEERGRSQEARATWKKVQELSPDDPDAAHAIGAASPAPGRGSSAGSVPSVAAMATAARPLPATAPEPARAPPPGRPPGVAARSAPAPAPVAAASAPAAPPSGADAVAKLLTETDVYVKYGLHQKALDHLAKVLALEPRCGDAHERSRDILLAMGRQADATRAGALAVRAFAAAGQLDRGRDAVARLHQLDPDLAELRELNALVGGTEEVELVGEAEEEEEEVVLAPTDVTEDGTEEPVDDDALALAAAGAADDDVVDEEDSEGDEALALAAARASVDAEEVVEEPPPRRASTPRPATTPPPVAAPSTAAAAPRPTPPVRPGATPPAQPAPRAASPAAAPPPARAAAPGPARRPPPDPEEAVDLSDEIEEADFFVQQGLFDDAREALRNLLAFYPDHPAVKAKLARLAELERKGGGAGAAPPALAGADQSFDIARELAELGGGADAAPAEDEFQYSVEDVFNQFKKGVEATVKREDSATHYDLGIAYKEMGLLDDAIHEFEIAIEGNDRRREVDCLSMVGLCQLAKGDGRAAIAAFRRALGSDHLTKDAAKAIHFELAAAHEGAGEAEAALHYYQRVAKVDPAFRDAAKRAAALGGGPGRAPADDPTARTRAPANGAPASRPAVTAPPVRPAGAGTPKKNIGYL